MKAIAYAAICSDAVTAHAIACLNKVFCTAQSLYKGRLSNSFVQIVLNISKPCLWTGVV